MENIDHYQRVYPTGQFLQWVLFNTTQPHADRHRLTSARRLQWSPFTLALWNNRYERQPTGRFNQHFQLQSRWQRMRATPDTSPKLIANSFNRQFTTSKLDNHFSLRRTRQVSKGVKRMSLKEAESFTSDQVTSAIMSCRNSRA